MTTPAPEGERAISSARDRGDPDALAEALAVHASTLVKAGRLTEARTEIDEAAAIHGVRGRRDDEARYATLAATLSRLSGDLNGARERFMVRDAGNPGGEAGTALELTEMLVGPDPSILENVLGLCPVRENSTDNTEQPLIITAHEEFVESGLTGADAGHDIGFGKRLDFLLDHTCIGASGAVKVAQRLFATIAPARTLYRGRGR